MDEELSKDVDAVLNLFVRPQLSNHGGGLEVVDLDEDDMSHFLQGGSFECSFYQPDDEYRIVRKQM